MVKGTDTIVFIEKCDVPFDRWRDITYGRICANYRPEKEDPYRIRLTFGGNLINFPGDCGTPTAGMLTVKMLLNSVVSTTDATFMTIDIKKFYLCTPMERPEFMRLKIADMPDVNLLLSTLIPQGFPYPTQYCQICFFKQRRMHAAAAAAAAAA